MAIYFPCACGQDLRADEAEAGGKKDCPACGSAAPVPSLALANKHLGIDTPPFPSLGLPRRAEAEHIIYPARESILALGDESAPNGSVYGLGPTPEASGEDDGHEAQLQYARNLFEQATKDANTPPRIGGWRLESNWLQCAFYPLRAWPILLGLAVAWATLVAILVTVLPDEWDATALGIRLPFLALGFLVVGFVGAFFRCVLASAAAGEAGFVRWPGADMLQVLWSGSACVVCFLAGPIIPAATAVWYWLLYGDLTWLDYLIINELALAAAIYWVLLLIAVDETGQLRAANPLTAVRVVVRVGWRVWLVGALASICLLLFLSSMLEALEDIHGGLGGWLALVWWGFLGTAFSVALLRWLGWSRFHARTRERADISPAAHRSGARPINASVSCVPYPSVTRSPLTPTYWVDSGSVSAPCRRGRGLFALAISTWPAKFTRS